MCMRVYGEENRARLRSVAKKYDPGNKFRELWKGYFKVKTYSSEDGRYG
jgi:hypothetical protein